MKLKKVNHPCSGPMAIGSLKPNPRNARTHSDRQIMQIAASIERFGFLVSIVVDDQNMIAAGHGRWLAAKRLKLPEVPVVRTAFLTDADRRAFALAENRIAQLSGWDEDLLGEELAFLFEGGNLEITGFTTADLDLSIPEPVKGKPERVELPDPAVWEALLGDERAAMAFTDLPYNVPIDGFVSGNGSVRHREFLQGAGEMTPPEFTGFIRRIFKNCVRFLADGAISFNCMDWRHTREILDAADGVYTAFKQQIVWDKGVGGQGAFYRSQHELVFVFKSGKAKHTNNFGLGETGRYRTNVVRYAGANSFRRGRARDLADHTTVKPTALVADFILDCSNPGELIVDPMVGSGTTLLAAHKTGRRGAGIELDPLYVDTALRRLSDATGLTLILVGDGRSFAEISAARRAEQED